MKGLIRNNYYSIRSSIKAALMINVVVTIFTLLFNLENNYPSSLSYCAIAVMGALGGACYTLIYNSYLSNWSTFELTTPISKVDVIKARYICFLMIACLALFCFCTYALVLFIGGSGLDAESAKYSMNFGVVFLLMVPSFMHLLILKFGIDKGQIIYLGSIAPTLLIYIGMAMIVETLSLNMNAYYFIIRIISILIFIVSYFVSKNMYLQQDL